jgi:predicted small secreted protein
MRWNNVIFGTAIGTAVGFLLGKSIGKTRITPERALNLVKEKFKAKGPINGSWIYMKPEHLSKEDLDFNVYYGGITRIINGESVPYEFFVDAHTGTLVDVQRR